MRAYSEEIAVGVIGAGGMGARHADNLHARVIGAKVAGVTDPNLSRAEEVAARCGPTTAVFEDELALTRDDGVDAVVVASPDNTHAGFVMECLRHEKPVLCEKPLTTSVEDARKIVEAEVELGRKLVQVGFMRRYDSQHLGVEDAVATGAVGRPVLFKGWHRNLAAPLGLTSEFVIFSAAVHDLDAARWLLGQEIEEVYVRGTNTEPGNDALDMQLMQLSLGGGCLGTIEVYMNAGYGYEVGVEVIGEAGIASTAPSGSPVLRRDQTLSQRIESDWLERFRTAYVIEMQQWIKDLHKGLPTGPDAWDGYMSLVAVESCIASLRSGSPQRSPTLERPALYEELGEVEK